MVKALYQNVTDVEAEPHRSLGGLGIHFATARERLERRQPLLTGAPPPLPVEITQQLVQVQEEGMIRQQVGTKRAAAVQQTAVPTIQALPVMSELQERDFGRSFC